MGTKGPQRETIHVGIKPNVTQDKTPYLDDDEGRTGYTMIKDRTRCKGTFVRHTEVATSGNFYGTEFQFAFRYDDDLQYFEKAVKLCKGKAINAEWVAAQSASPAQSPRRNSIVIGTVSSKGTGSSDDTETLLFPNMRGDDANQTFYARVKRIYGWSYSEREWTKSERWLKRLCRFKKIAFKKGSHIGSITLEVCKSRSNWLSRGTKAKDEFSSKKITRLERIEFVQPEGKDSYTGDSDGHRAVIYAGNHTTNATKTFKEHMENHIVLEGHRSSNDEHEVWILSPYNPESNELSNAEVVKAIKLYVSPRRRRLNSRIARFIRESERIIRLP